MGILVFLLERFQRLLLRLSAKDAEWRKKYPRSFRQSTDFIVESRLWLVFFLQVAILPHPRCAWKEAVIPAMTIRIGVISDTHLRRVTQDFRHVFDHYLSDMDMILHAGDYVSPEVVQFLNKKEFNGVHGNMDSLEIKRTLPEKKVIEVGAWRLGLIHGWGSPEGLEERIWKEFQNVDVIVYGHAHKAANHMREGVLLFNPGTVAGYTSSGVHSVGVLEVGDSVRGEIVDII
jgi:putative phosphoesterase